jgi:hypothetical protein
MGDVMNTNAAVENNFNKPFTLESLGKVLNEMKQNKQNVEWGLISPDGQFYKGNMNQIMSVLMQHHPLLVPGKIPY